MDIATTKAISTILKPMHGNSSASMRLASMPRTCGMRTLVALQDIAMRKLYYMGLESYEARYTLQLTEWNRRVFERRGLDVVYGSVEKKFMIEIEKAIESD